LSGPDTTQPLFLGFFSIEDLAHELAKSRDLVAYLLPLAEVTRSGGMGLKSHSITVQGLTRSGSVVAYCKVDMGWYDCMSSGLPLDAAAAAAVNRRTETAEPLVRAWLQARGFEVVPATFAPPKDYRMLLGTAGFLTVDKATHTVTLRPQEGGAG
jgi:hypothetical protein